MVRTYIKLNVAVYREMKEGGVFLDSISNIREFDDKRTLLYFSGNGHAIINKPLAEVEQLLADANRRRPAQLDWREISGDEPKPPKAPKPPKKGLAERFHFKK